MFYKIISSKRTYDKVFVPKNFLAGVAFVNSDSVNVSAGGKKQSTEVVLSDELSKYELMISENILEELSIPIDISYQVVVERNTIKLGPVTGLLMAESMERLTRGVLRKLEDYGNIYPETQGLMIAFSVEGIDFKNQLVKGYYYNSSVIDKASKWKEGTFPFPDAIFQRIGLSEDIRLRLKRETHNRMFNSNYFNKLEFSNMVSKYKSFLGCIPETHSVKSIEDLDNMLSKYKTVYLKPIYGTLSRGLYRVTENNGIYGFQGKRGSGITELNSKEEVKNYLDNIISNHHYIVQQAIQPLKVEERHLDFRVIMQKDHTMVWSCTGIVGFVGAKGDICTNWGFTSSFENTLRKHFKFTQGEIFKKKQEVIAFCKRICDMLDSKGENYGDLGFDVMLDEKLKVWILEVNKRHYHSTPLWINDVQTYYEVKAKPIKYAVALGGFKVY